MIAKKEVELKRYAGRIINGNIISYDKLVQYNKEELTYIYTIITKIPKKIFTKTKL